jgi:hypothetical protein
MAYFKERVPIFVVNKAFWRKTRNDLADYPSKCGKIVEIIGKQFAHFDKMPIFVV